VLATSGTAAARTPLPTAAAGAGAAPTAAGGKLAGRPFTARSAIVERGFYGELNLYVFATNRGCGTVSFFDRPYVWISIDTGGRRIVAGTPIASSSGADVTANIAGGPHRQLLTAGVSVTFTRVDPRLGSLWHGTFELPAPAAGSAAAVAGSFAAHWCGQA
jgi:hypothetical protein